MPAPAAANAKPAKPAEKDSQLEKAISILEHWNKYKVQLAKADDSTATTDSASSSSSPAPSAN